MSVGDTPAVDLAVVMARLNGDRDLLAELAGLYLEDEPALVAQLRDAVGRGDAEGVRRAAHALKGSVANFAAADAQAAAFALEQAGRNRDLAAAPTLLDALHAELTAVREALTHVAAGASGH
jgi:HPt (histidine-containing phosphotransfer) domain-containing protein